MRPSMPVTGGTYLQYAACPIYHKIDFFSKSLILIYKLRIVFIFLRNRSWRGLACLKRASTPFTVSMTFCSKL